MSRKICANCETSFDTKGFEPFCSKRCADVDLHHWMQGSYVIPGNGLETEENIPPFTSSQDDER